MRRLHACAVIGTTAATVGAGPANAATKTFGYSGKEQAWIVPAGVHSLEVTAIGAAGGSVPYTGGTVPGGQAALVDHAIAAQSIGAFATPATLSWTLYDLTPNTTYYYRLYAFNGAGVVYGAKLSFTTQAA
jgi:hypothetical protein